jgi:hypothetical protein
MKKKIAIISALALCTLAAPRPASADDVPAYPGAPVVQIQSPDGRPCTLFRLKDVNQASSARVSPWFAVNQSTVGYKEMVSILLMAFASGKSVTVGITGGLDGQCGEAQVTRVFVQ